MTSKRRVVKFILYDEQGRLLLTLRESEEEKSPDMWHFPTGQIEPGEQPEEALVREMREELGLEAEEQQLLFEQEAHGEYYYAYALPLKGEPASVRLGEGRGFALLRPEEIKEYCVSPGTKLSLPHLSAYFARQS